MRTITSQHPTPDLQRRCRRALAAAWLGGLMLAATASAGLQWQATELTVPMTSPMTTEVEGTFHFTNTGTTPVTIRDVRTTCSCTAAVPDKTVYQPGETGTLAARLKVSRGSTLLRKAIYVTTDAADAPMTQLELVCQTRAFFSCDQQWLAWRIGDAAATRVIRATADGDRPIHIKDIRSVAAGFRYELRTVRDGWEYELHITPTDTRARHSQTLTLVTDYPCDPPLELDIRVSVLPIPQRVQAAAGTWQTAMLTFAAGDWGVVMGCMVMAVVLAVVILWIVRQPRQVSPPGDDPSP